MISEIAIWGLAEITNYNWHDNYSEPYANEFLWFQEELQYEVIREAFSPSSNKKRSSLSN